MKRMFLALLLGLFLNTMNAQKIKVKTGIEVLK